MERTGIGDAELARRIPVSRPTLIRWKEGVTTRPRYREDVVRCAELLRLTQAETDEFLLAAGFSPETAPVAEDSALLRDLTEEPEPVRAEESPRSTLKRRGVLIAVVVGVVVFVAVVVGALAISSPRQDRVPGGGGWESP